jgi:hypothetical protein
MMQVESVVEVEAGADRDKKTGMGMGIEIESEHHINVFGWKQKRNIQRCSPIETVMAQNWLNCGWQSV